MNLLKYLICFLLFNILLAAIPLWAQYNDYRSLLIPHFWPLFAIFSLQTLLMHLFVHWRMTISDHASGQALLASLVFKLIFSILIVIFYLENVPVDATYFLLNFFYLYSFHTAFEIYCLLRNLRNQNSK